ncbi:hypothetical protein ALQ95_200140 [Pseudomonas syringae pv. ribicola]|uniref:Uncharacterized protein n=1 Tax=Pseudomonas syringae pv. ribicola TaxID=55398 RepID=A0A3M2VKI8_PSESI|nr:hypothetical protein ALQ95_200140 [Pseudomonas syringae pv. ribicola]
MQTDPCAVALGSALHMIEGVVIRIRNRLRAPKSGAGRSVDDQAGFLASGRIFLPMRDSLCLLMAWVASANIALCRVKND